jgi:hypothetical protein
MMKYLSSSRFFSHVRKHLGIEKPYALEWGGWKKWENKIRSEHPVGFFLTETLPDFLDKAWDKITSPYYSTRYYIRNRFIRKTHVLRTDCEPGKYMDTDQRMLSALANAVIDYVEIELAYKSLWCATPESKTAVWKDGRCAELGLEYLNWEADLVQNEHMGLELGDLDYGKPSPQAETAREIKAIYEWAKNRDKRPDPYEASGWSAYCDKYSMDDIMSNDRSAEQEAESDTAHKKLREIEESYEREDEDMLIRLIKIRRSLWT